MTVAVFSLTFSSAGKGPFMASKAKKIYMRWHFPGGKGDSGVEDMAHPRWEIQELSSLKRCSPILRPILHKSAVVIFKQQ